MYSTCGLLSHCTVALSTKIQITILQYYEVSLVVVGLILLDEKFPVRWNHFWNGLREANGTFKGVTLRCLLGPMALKPE